MDRWHKFWKENPTATPLEEQAKISANLQAQIMAANQSINSGFQARAKYAVKEPRLNIEKMAQTSSEEEDASQAESDESSLKLQPTSSKHAEKLFTPQTPPKPKTPKKTSPPKKKTSPPKEVLNVFKFPSQVPSQVASEAPTVEEESPARTRAEKRQKIQELKEYRDKVEEELETAKEKFKKRRDGAHRLRVENLKKKLMEARLAVMKMEH